MKMVLLAFLLTGSLGLSTVAFAESFDKPLRTVVVDVGQSHYDPRNASRIKLSCFYYPDFMAKELFDPGMKGGVQWLTTVPIPKGHPSTCRRSHSPSERFIKTEYWWSFQGVKGSLMFLEAADGDNNAGMPFRVLDWKTGRKIFQDSAGGGINHLEFGQAGGKLTAKYLRRVGEDCSIPKDGTSCWNRFREKYSLTQPTVPKCLGYREEGAKPWVVGDEGVPPAELDTPSVIDYPVTVSVFPKPSIVAAPGSAACYPTE